MSNKPHCKQLQTAANNCKPLLAGAVLSVLVLLPALGTAATQCFTDLGDFTLSSTYYGYAQYYNPNLRPDQYDTLSNFNFTYQSRPDSCAFKSTTSPSRGPVQVQYGPGIVEVSFYDWFVISSLGPPDRCGNIEYVSKWKFSGTNIVPGSAGVFCLSQVVQASALSLAVLLPTTREVHPTGTAGNSTAELVAKVVDGTTPKAGVAVQFTAEVTDKSGGHDHSDASRPKGKLSIAQGTTDANGEVKVTFTAPEIAGIHTIKATCANCTNSPASAEVKVKVPGLVDIFGFPVPLLDPRWAYPGVGARTNEHTDQHYLTAAATVRLVDISRKYLKIWPTAPKLTLNDASLIWGGKYDLSLTWERNTKRHAEHRVGENIDVRANTAPGAVPANIRAAVFRWLRKASRPEDNIPAEFVIDSVNPLHEGIGDANEHFHLRLGN